MWRGNKGVSSAIVVILLAAAGIIIATLAIKFLISAGQSTTIAANKSLEGALNALQG